MTVVGSPWDADGTRAAVQAAIDRLDVCVPGAGRTAERLLALHDLAAVDVALARLCEAHLDAVAILSEAGMAPRDGVVYGVWAAVRPDGGDVRLVEDRLCGTKSFCSGIGIVDRALVEVTVDGARQLVDTDVRLVAGTDGWRSPQSDSSATVDWHDPGLAVCNTGSVTFVDQRDVEAVGQPGWYVDRVGFWHGACGPAACWAGGASGLLPHAVPGDDPYRLAAAGALASASWAMRAVLERAGDEIDAGPDDHSSARRRAGAVRHTVHELATTVLDRFGRAWGPRPLVSDPVVARRVADVQIYLRQHNDERDLAALGRHLWPAS